MSSLPLVSALQGRFGYEVANAEPQIKNAHEVVAVSVKAGRTAEGRITRRKEEAYKGAQPMDTPSPGRSRSVDQK
jgi:hypothetical protein